MSSSFKLEAPIISKGDILPVFLICGTILFCFNGIFFGADFFVHSDEVSLSGYTYGNSIGNGWRPEKGFGMSNFFGDSHIHAWGFLSFFEKIFPSREQAYTSSIILLDSLAAIVLYFFLRLIAPGLGRWVWLLCLLVVFCTHQPGIHFLRCGNSMVGAPILLIVLFNYYKSPKRKHFFQLALIFWFVFFLSTFFSWSNLLSLGAFFTMMYYLYYKEPFKEIVTKYLLLFFIGVGMATLLCFWIFYSNLLESAIIGQTRAKTLCLFPQGFSLLPDVKVLFKNLICFLQVVWLDRELGVPLRTDYSYNVTAVFPLIFIYFLLRRATSFWEFLLKGLVTVFWIHITLSIFPAYRDLYAFINRKSNYILCIYDLSVVYIAQIGLIAIFISRINKGDLVIRQLWGQILQKGLAFILFMFYMGLFVFSVLAIFLPIVLPTVISWVVELFGPSMIGTLPKDLLATCLSDCIRIMQSSMHWYSVIFFMLSALFMLLFMRNKWCAVFAERPKLIAVLLLITSIFMTWSVYPLNTKKLVWEEVAQTLPEFKPTDRFYFVKHDNLQRQTLDVYNQRLNKAGGLQEYYSRPYGYRESPGLMLHGHTSFHPDHVAEYIYDAFNGDGVERLVNLRDLTKGPLIFSELLDMGAVNYYYSERELQNVPESLSLYFKSKWLFIYKNLNAWPYFYLAEQIDVKKERRHLENVRRGTAYLAKEACFPLPENAGNSFIELKGFSYGKMVFDFSGSQEEFLVVADAWHPFWKAYVGNKNLPIIKANEIFKGVRLPEGEYTLTMEFDTSQYLPGVYVTIISWVLFLAGGSWMCFRRKRGKLDACIPSLVGLK